MAKTVIAVLLLVAPAVAELGFDHVVAVPMVKFPQTCGLPANMTVAPKMAALLQDANVPGAGIKKFTPFKTILKDGFMEIDCVKDYMYYRGDKFGDNKHDYKLADTSDVSIVHYDAFVPKEDQVEMTQKVCFEFCRTVPNMGFFGVVNGRGCYCTPYFKPMESDSTQCDSVCEGDTTLMCGGKSKSSIFSMHMCASTGDDLKEVSGNAGTLQASMSGKSKLAKTAAGNMQDAAAALQKKFGAVGDSGATGLMQEAKVFAGEIEKSNKAVEGISSTLKELMSAASKMVDFTDPAVVTAAERNMEDTEQAIAEGTAAEAELDDLLELATEKSVNGAADQYYPIMYFVDKEFDSVPSTCGGKTTEKPITGVSKDGCAAACDGAIHSCVGYQYFTGGAAPLCFLFSKFETAFYYTGCSFLQTEKKPAFLQTEKAAPFEAGCYGKLSKFEGTSMKVDKSGKTDSGLKKITKADRCY